MFEILFLASTLPDALCANEAQTLIMAANRIEKAYVLEDTASVISNDLRTLASEMPKTQLCNPEEDFASALTKTLRTLSKDGHFYVEQTNDEGDDDWITTWRASGFKSGQGIKHVEVLDGNIGYIRIKSFYELEPAFPHYRAAFDMVADTEALVLDFRDNHGGSPQTAWPVQWTFLKSGSPSPMMMDSRIEEAEEREEPAVLWARYGTKRPLAVLTNGDTFSAPEAVAYTLQSADRATIIGEPSGGGAHLLDSGVDFPTGFTLYTPTMRPISVESGENWEGKGITPDIYVPSTEALESAVQYLRKAIVDQSSG